MILLIRTIMLIFSYMFGQSCKYLPSKKVKVRMRLFVERRKLIRFFSVTLQSTGKNQASEFASN